jgi:hypothetical protein
MSDLAGLIAISFLGVMGFFLSLYIAGKANTTGTQIVTGVVHGSPISTGVRTAMLFQMWLPYQVAGAASGIFLTIAQLEMADHVSDPGVKLLAHFAAFIAGVGALFYLVIGPAGFFQYRAFLRRAQRQ